MTCELCVILLFLATQSCDPKELDPDQTTALFEEGEAQRAGHLKSMTRTVENTKRKLALAKSGKYYADAGGGFSFEEEFRNKAEKDKAIAAYQERLDSIQKRLAELRDESIPIVPDILNSVRVGSIGQLPFVAKVQQKLSDTEAILEVVVEDQIAQANDGSGTQTQLAYCSGFDFSSVVDGGGFAFRGSVACAQTKTYRTAIGGSKTIPLLEPIDLSAYVAKETQRRQESKRRKWTDRTGAFSVAAIFLGLKEGKVTLLKEDRSEIVVPLSSLSASDQDYIRKEIATRKAKD